MTTVSVFPTAGPPTSSVELAAPLLCDCTGSRIFLHLKNIITTPIIKAKPSTPPTVPPMIAPLSTFFFSPLLAAVAVALLVPVEEGLIAVEEWEVVGAVVVAKCATVVMNAWPDCPAKEVSAGRGS